jgi:uncharacterized protein YebE (UPF0316 family)
MKIIQDIFNSSELFQYLVVPVFIFAARVVDVSVSTIRMMFVWAGNRYLATLLGFFEALIWIVAIGQIMKDISNWSSYIAYAAGYAGGTFTGMFIESKLAYGKSIIQVITKNPACKLIEALKAEDFGITCLQGEGNKGDKVHVFYTVLSRRKVDYVTGIIRLYNPDAFFTIENIRFVNDKIPETRLFSRIFQKDFSGK